MQPQRHYHKNPCCASCNSELSGREWRVRNVNGYGESWHPRCFASSWPGIDIEVPPHTPPAITTIMQEAQALRQQAMPVQEQTCSQETLGSPENPIRNDTLPPLHGWAQLDWDDILEYTPTARYVPPQCQAMYIKLLRDTCDQINEHTRRANFDEAENGWKLLLSIPRMVLSNAHRHRAGHRGQGHASLTKTIRQRINLIYSGRWEELLTHQSAPLKRGKPNQQQQHQQRDKQDIANIMKHLRDDELSYAIRVLNGPPKWHPQTKFGESCPRCSKQMACHYRRNRHMLWALDTSKASGTTSRRY